MSKEIIIVKGTVELLTPALIGSGRSDATEMDLQLDGNGKVLIPATSLVGVLRHGIQLDDSLDAKLNDFWGFCEKPDKLDTSESSETKGRRSRLFCADLTCDTEKTEISIRDGIAIDSATGMVKENAKYDYEVLEPGPGFSLYMEIKIDDSMDGNFAKKMLATIVEKLESGNMHIGAKTNNGLGKIRLVKRCVRGYDLSKKEDVQSWFAGLASGGFDSRRYELPAGFGDSAGKMFVIEAAMRLDNSFIIRSYSDDPALPDAVSLKSGTNFVISGSSLKGAMRSRAERILNTLRPLVAASGGSPRAKGRLFPPRVAGPLEPQRPLWGSELEPTVRGGSDTIPTGPADALFGYVDESSNTKLKGRLRVDEVILPEMQPETQTRIKIDRFTGGTIEGALFESMPLFTDGNEKNCFRLRFEIADYTPAEAGLLLLVLKDLWTGDLAVGGEKNVGRGVFQGVRADIRWWDEEKEKMKDTTLNNDFMMPPEDEKILEGFVEALVKVQGGNECAG
ncbi:MAG: hypothetical protein GY765_25105 [bacterium]|nr:hypothetical protein [bacterium]